MRLVDHLAPGAALPRLTVSAPDEAVVRLTRAVADAAGVADPDALVRAVLAREQQGDTVLGLGAAVPHAHTPLVDTLHLGVATFAAPCPCPGGEVDMLFLLVGPEAAPRLMLQALARLARLLKLPDFPTTLRRARSPEALAAVLARAADAD